MEVGFGTVSSIVVLGIRSSRSFFVLSVLNIHVVPVREDLNVLRIKTELRE
jgi:hypothetical protein